MKKKSLISWMATTACIASLNVKAQAPLAWSTDNFLFTYPQFQSGYQMPQKIETASDGSVFAAGTFFFVTYQRKLSVIKYNSAGDSVAAYIDDDPTATASLNNYVNDMLIDDNDNMYVLGTTSDSVQINGLNYQGTTRLYKLGSDLTLIWSRDITHYDMTSMIFDASGNIVLSGTTKNNGDGTLKNIFAMAFDPGNGLLWKKRYSSAGAFDDTGADIAADGAGNVYVVGTSNGSGNSKKLKTIKYDNSGNIQWIKDYNTFTTAGAQDQAQSVAVSPSGNVYVAGVVTTGFSNVALRSILIKYDIAGVRQWHKVPLSTVGTRSMIPAKVRIDANENVYLASLDRPFSYSQFSNSGKSVSIKKYSSSGQYAWTLVRDTSDVFDFDVTPAGTIYAAGSKGVSTYASPVLAHYNAYRISTAGVLEWEDSYLPTIFNDQTGTTGWATCLNVSKFNPTEITVGSIENAGQPNSFNSNQWNVRHYSDVPAPLKLSAANSNNNFSNKSIEMNISPDPATDYVQITSTIDLSHTSISIKNLLGQNVKRFTSLNSEIKIVVSDLQPGFYFVGMQKDNGHITKKFLKQ